MASLSPFLLVLKIPVRLEEYDCRENIRCQFLSWTCIEAKLCDDFKIPCEPAGIVFHKE